MYVVDTHPLLWFLSSDSRLSKKAKSIFESAEEGEESIIIPSIVIAESIYIAEKKGYSLQMRDIIEDLEISSNYVMKSMDYSILKSISTDNRDFSIHDKIIVHTGEIGDHKIISRDEKIQDEAEVEVIW
ncbi:MAG: type II toxin-antitoxin system VapC family toxin [Thermoplasmatota archaeon]